MSCALWAAAASADALGAARFTTYGVYLPTTALTASNCATCMIANWWFCEILGAARSSGSAMSFQSVMTFARTVVAASRTPTVRMFIFVFMSG